MKDGFIHRPCILILKPRNCLAGVKIIGPTKASLISCFELLATILFTVLLLGTVLLPSDYAGMACIMVTVVMLTVMKNR